MQVPRRESERDIISRNCMLSTIDSNEHGSITVLFFCSSCHPTIPSYTEIVCVYEREGERGREREMSPGHILLLSPYS
jgi:hypothetical protein